MLSGFKAIGAVREDFGMMMMKVLRSGCARRLMLAFTLAFAPLGAMAQEAVDEVPAAPDAAAPAPAAPEAAPAAPAAPAGAAATRPQPPGTWAKYCNTDPATQKELCMVILELHANNGRTVASVSIRQVTGEDKISMVAAIPPGMLIQPGLRLMIDGGKPTFMKFGICFPNACYGELEINKDFIGLLKGGSKLVLTTLNTQGKPIAFPITLAGFTKVYDGRANPAPTTSDAAPAQSRADLENALQDAAEAQRKKLIEQQQKEAGQGN
jgi:invasion protein IalB